MYGMYDVTCTVCEFSEERLLPKEGLVCQCGGVMTREYPKEAALGFQPFEAYHDEALGIDVNGRREKKQALREMGLQEAGDPVGGMRKKESYSGAQTLGSDQPLTGLRLSDVQRAKAEKHEPNIGIQKKDGSVSPVRFTDLPEPATPNPNAREERRKMQHQIASESGTGE